MSSSVWVWVRFSLTASSWKGGRGGPRPPCGLPGAGAEALHLIGEGRHPAGILGAEGRGGGGEEEEKGEEKGEGAH
uniref:Uncharacterized protein n=1 Tax=Thermus sp. 4C TaxID=446041 RepID=A6MN63_9DEIN|nr:hypothetical protein [Thermus sp. 4C]